MQLFGVRKAAVAEPKLLVETLCVDNERLAFPLADGASVVQWIVRIAAQLSLLLPPIGVDDPIIAIPATDKNKHPLAFAVFVELNAVGQLVLSWTAWRHAVQIHRIVLQEIALPQFIEIASPFSKWRNLIDIRTAFY